MKIYWELNNPKINKALLGAALGISIAASALAMPLGGGTAFAATKTTAAVAEASGRVADNVIAEGKKYMGVRYLFGAASNRTDAFDCSSLVQYLFKKNGIQLPRSSRDQAKAGVFVSKNDLKPGDLVFSDTNKDGVINHVSLYIGDGKLLHTYRVGIGVTISDFEGSAWDRTYVTARRVIAEESGSSAEQSPEDDRKTETVQSGNPAGSGEEAPANDPSSDNGYSDAQADSATHDWTRYDD